MPFFLPIEENAELCIFLTMAPPHQLTHLSAESSADKSNSDDWLSRLIIRTEVDYKWH